MRRALALSAVLALAAAGCGSEKKSKERSSERLPVQGETVGIPKEGDPTMKVTLLQVFDPIEGDSSDKPHKGNRFIGIRFRIENRGKDPYVDAPARGSILIMSDQKGAALADLSGGECSQGLGFGVTIKPGDAKSICQPFEAKEALKPTEFLFTLGTLPDSAEWSLAE